VTFRRRSSSLFVGLLLAALVGGGGLSCAVNPATGERQLSLIGEGREIEMGREAHPEILRTFGVYPDSTLQAYVSDLGQRMAQVSERPRLPWTFTVVDDPVVNAFALPGGFIYMTRGILAHFQSEAQLAAVLGHEIGHVTARHSVNQMSRAQLAQVGLGVGSIFAPEVAPFMDLAGASLQLLFLKFGRDDERQSDDLGYRYMTRLDYDPGEMTEVFAMLGRVSEAAGGGDVPGWLSTHPDPENREERILERIAADPAAPTGGIVREAEYLRRLDGVVFGANPRHGFFQGADFYHPDLAFHLRFPEGWRTVNQQSAVQAVSPEQDALLLLTLAEHDSPAVARRSFFSGQGISADGIRDDSVNGLEAAWAQFTATTEQGRLRGMVLFVRLGDQVYRILGFTPESRWRQHRDAILFTLDSFERETRSEVLSVQPARVEIVELSRPTAFQAFVERHPSSIPDARVALLNQVSEDATLRPGLYKRVTGGEIPEIP